MTYSFAWGFASGIWFSVVIVAATWAIIWLGTKK